MGDYGNEASRISDLIRQYKDTPLDDIGDVAEVEKQEDQSKRATDLTEYMDKYKTKMEEGGEEIGGAVAFEGAKKVYGKLKSIYGKYKDTQKELNSIRKKFKLRQDGEDAGTEGDTLPNPEGFSEDKMPTSSKPQKLEKPDQEEDPEALETIPEEEEPEEEEPEDKGKGRFEPDEEDPEALETIQEEPEDQVPDNFEGDGGDPSEAPPKGSEELQKQMTPPEDEDEEEEEEPLGFEADPQISAKASADIAEQSTRLDVASSADGSARLGQPDPSTRSSVPSEEPAESGFPSGAGTPERTLGEAAEEPEGYAPELFSGAKSSILDGLKERGSSIINKFQDAKNFVTKGASELGENVGADTGEAVATGLAETGEAVAAGVGEAVVGAVPVLGEIALVGVGLVKFGEAIYHLFHPKHEQAKAINSPMNIAMPTASQALTSKYAQALPSIDTAQDVSASVMSF